MVPDEADSWPDQDEDANRAFDFGYPYPDTPVAGVCPLCKGKMVTTTEKAPGVGNFMICWFVACASLCTLAICAPFAFYVDRFKDTKHYCSHCGIYLGKKENMVWSDFD